MKNMKKIFTLVMALAMLLSLAIPAAAADEHTNHTITIVETNPGHVFQAYQIFAGDVETVNDQDILSDIRWGSGVDTARAVEWTYNDGTQDVTVSLTLLQALQNEYINPDYYSHYLNDKEAADVVETLSTNNTTAHAQVFARIVSKYLSGTYTESKAYQQTGTDSNGKPIYTEVANTSSGITCYQIAPLSDGYYLVKEKDGNDVDPETHTEYMLRLVKDVTVEPKDGVVTVEKKIIEGNKPVDACSNNIGDIIEFHIEAGLPKNYAEYDSFYFEFADTLSEGLTLDETTIKLYTINGDDLKEISPDYYTVYVGSEVQAAIDSGALENYDTSRGVPNLVVVFEDLKDLTDSSDYTVINTTSIRLAYSAVLNEKAEIGNPGNPNDVYVRYDRNPYKDGLGETEKDIVHVFTFELDVTKIDGSKTTDNTLEGVKFVLARERSGHYQYVVLNDDNTVKGWTNWIDEADLNEYVKTTYAAEIEAGTVVLADKVTELKTSVGVASELTTDADGKFIVKGLDLDTYWLIETQELPGYNKVDPIKFTISADYDDTTRKVVNLKITLEGKDPASGDNDTGIVTTTVVNNPGHELPTTGGMGTTLFYLVGGMMVCAAVILLITKKRMSA